MQPMQRNPSSYTAGAPQAGTTVPRRPSPTESQQQRQQMQTMAPNYVSGDVPRDDPRQKQQFEAGQRQRMMEIEEQNRRDLETYNASIPKAKIANGTARVGWLWRLASPSCGPL